MATTRPVLKKGMSGKAGTAVGDAIFLWRNFMGLPPAAGVKVFDFGTQTHDRTVAWQIAQQLSSRDGRVGPESWARYDSLQYGPPAPPVVEAATKAAAGLKQESEAPAPAAVAASATIKKTKPPAKVAPAAVAASQKITAATTTPTPVMSVPKTVEEAKVVATVAASKVVKVVEDSPLWLRVGGTALGVVFAIKGLRKLFGM